MLEIMEEVTKKIANFGIRPVVSLKQDIKTNGYALNGIWNIQSNDSITIVDNGKTVDSCQLTNYKIVKLFFTDTDQNVVLVSVPSSVNLKKDYILTNTNELKIGLWNRQKTFT